MEQLGARLKAAREASGRTLRDIAATTKISVTALEAVERNDYSRLPGGIFGRAFIRAYAVEVGLDPEATVREFVAEVDAIERRAAKNVRVPEVTREDQLFLERQRLAARVLRIAIALLVLAAIAFAVWRLRVVWSGAPSSPPARAAETPPARDYRPPPPDAPLVAPGATPQSTATPGPEAATSVSTPTPAPDRAAESALRVELNVTSDCWVQVSADGLVVFERLLRAGERQQFSADHELALDVGDAGALVWSINGRPAKSLGKSGAHKQAHVTLATVGDFLQ